MHMGPPSGSSGVKAASPGMSRPGKLLNVSPCGGAEIWSNAKTFTSGRCLRGVQFGRGASFWCPAARWTTGTPEPIDGIQRSRELTYATEKYAAASRTVAMDLIPLMHVSHAKVRKQYTISNSEPPRHQQETGRFHHVAYRRFRHSAKILVSPRAISS